MKKLTLEFMTRCWSEGVYGIVEPTHIRLNILRFEEVKRLLSAVKYGGPEPMTIDNMVFQNASLVFTPEVAENSIGVVNIKWLSSVPYAHDSYFDKRTIPCELTFMRSIQGVDVCACCGQPYPEKQHY